MRLLLGIVSFALAAAAATLGGELALRAMAPTSDGIALGVRLPDSPRRYGLEPGARSLHLNVDVQINSLGFREREYPREKPAGARRVVVLGDSYTFGVGAELADTFSKRLERRLNEFGGVHEVINFGVSGYNTVLELATFREAAAAFHPDLVILAYVLNDTEPYPDGGGAAQTGPSGGASLLSRAHLRIKERSLLYRYLAPAGSGSACSPSTALHAIRRVALRSPTVQHSHNVMIVRTLHSSTG